jgi:hypothetical protein
MALMKDRGDGALINGLSKRPVMFLSYVSRWALPELMLIFLSISEAILVLETRNF